MKATVKILLLIFAIGVPVSAQSILHDIDRIREIKLLESDRFGVIGIMGNFRAGKLNEDERSQVFSRKDLWVQISYSAGSCSAPDEIWDAPEWKVTFVEIRPKALLRPADLPFDLSEFKKQQAYVNRPKSFLYESSKLGIALAVDEDKVDMIWLFPDASSPARLCKTDNGKIFGAKGIFGASKLEDRKKVTDERATLISDVTLSKQEIKYNDEDRKVVVKVAAYATDEEVLEFTYTVSAGRIIGEGQEVIWDLTGVKPGTYTITAEINDSCLLCPDFKTVTISIRGR